MKMASARPGQKLGRLLERSHDPGEHRIGMRAERGILEPQHPNAPLRQPRIPRLVAHDRRIVGVHGTVEFDRKPGRRAVEVWT
jgi:hypothetical protein